ncbi:MAG: DEAD/DEAH box helicase family protein [Candidatus Helarchaeota archaeon]|nr:DEAD/DEAH box helicase family protein [Candidatus Helarchaeota archaeon]
MESLKYLKFEPREYQSISAKEALDEIEKGKRLIIILLPTGTGKTKVGELIITEYILKGKLKKQDKILFLAPDRKMKHQLYEVANEDGLSHFGNLFIFPEGKTVPPKMIRKHFKFSKFIFSTPELLFNAVFPRNPRMRKVELEDMKKIKLVIIDEILEVLAQKFGKEKFRVNLRFRPLLEILGVFDPNSTNVFVGLTATISQFKKREILIDLFGGKEKAAEVKPTQTEDYKEHAPAIIVKKFYAFDDFVKGIDVLFMSLNSRCLSILRQAHRILTGSPLEGDRTLLFANEMLKKQDVVKEHFIKRKRGELFERARGYAGAYLDLVVARQMLFEHGLPTLYKFIHSVKNSILLKSDEWNDIIEQLQIRWESPDGIITKKEERLIELLKRKVIKEKKRGIVFCRFVLMTKNLYRLAEAVNIKSTFIHGKMEGVSQNSRINQFKNGEVDVLFASKKLIERGTDIPQADFAIHYGTTMSASRREQSMGRIRSTMKNLKEDITILYHETAEQSKFSKLIEDFMQNVEKVKVEGWTIFKDGEISEK